VTIAKNPFTSDPSAFQGLEDVQKLFSSSFIPSIAHTDHPPMDKKTIQPTIRIIHPND
jgi:hypothetical protein